MGPEPIAVPVGLPAVLGKTGFSGNLIGLPVHLWASYSNPTLREPCFRPLERKFK
jgi:hypothetical protein